MDTELITFLSEIFSCPADVAASIGRRAVDRRYPLRTIILKQGDRAGATYLLVIGRAHAFSYGNEGQIVLLREFARGDFFGALGDRTPEEADIMAIEDVRTTVFGASDFLALLENHACVGLVLSRALMKQLRASSTRIVESATLSAAGRIYAELLRLARLGDGRTIQPAPVLSSLATRVASTRETVSRTINALERRGIVRRQDGALIIVAPQRLEGMTV